MQYTKPIITSSSQVADLLRIFGEQIDELARGFADSLISAIGKIERALQDFATSLRRVIFAGREAQRIVSTESLAATAHKLMLSFRANQVTIYTPQTGNTLASFKKVYMPVTTLDLRGMHTRNQCQLTGTLLLLDVIGAHGRANLRVDLHWFQKWTCETVDYVS